MAKQGAQLRKPRKSAVAAVERSARVATDEIEVVTKSARTAAEAPAKTAGKSARAEKTARPAAARPEAEAKDDSADEPEVEAELEFDESKLGDDEPSPEQLERARTEAEKALKELERQGAGDSTLSRYFREMASHRVLTPQEEIEAAQLVERLEIAYWEALFSYLPCFETVASVIEHHLPEAPADLLTLRKMSRGARGRRRRGTS